ncbi:MAG: sucrose-6-phosphate hydrolase [Loigolactobacillus coryniformis]|uniref:sucrose-6-phosphate hydrolase n=1 Tax=Loigolactobacillus coryniformis TaxID=1610 RepID=UPI002648751C|nr:sucrose-6-phosphate hydrolase [Loigolactobacillus coryniformis]MDN5954517.1 sucrose-6-phosphate hydrolase [Loigolactobacillus coryniformis]
MTLIKKWTRALRYQSYSKWPPATQQALLATVSTSPWRLGYHIQSDSGLLNDPNGFAYFNNKWHLYYQNFPFGPVHGLKSWRHLTSDDLVHWQKTAGDLLPDSAYDSHGAYSGSALPLGNQLFLMYTGNVRDANWQRHPYQNGAVLDQHNQLTKLSKPLISEPPAGYTSEFRDPQIIAKQDQYWAFIGGQTNDKVGTILVYQSNDLHQWDFMGPLQLDQPKIGYMIECPNLIQIGNTTVLISCPQGLAQSTLAYQNIYPNTYLLSDQVDWENLTFNAQYSLKLLDDGFDVYATQAINAPDGRALAVSWIGLPEIDYPTDRYGWAHCLSLIKELTIKDGHLYQYPVSENQKLRTDEQQFNVQATPAPTVIQANSGQQYELALNLAADQEITLHIAENSDASAFFEVKLNSKIGVVTVDRQAAGEPFAEKYGTVRTSQLPAHHAITLNLFVDHSVCEMYLNHGYTTLTARFFPKPGQQQLSVSSPTTAELTGKFWQLNAID